LGLILAGSAMIGLAAGACWLLVDAVRDRQAARALNGQVREIIAFLELDRVPDFHQRLDLARSFINDHSVNEMDELFFANRGNAAAYAAGVIGHAKGAAGEPAHMECSTRTNLMGSILQTLGYQTRVIAIFDSDSNLKSHSFLEVMNPETGRWETQDPDYDVYWRDKATGERVSLADVAEQLELIEPCGRAACGWELSSREGHKIERVKPYLDIISITDKGKSIRYALYTSRADLSRIYRKEGGDTGLFCEVEAKRCKQGFYDLKAYSSYAAGLPR
jgi:hypothetical protein